MTPYNKYDAKANSNTMEAFVSYIIVAHTNGENFKELR